MQSCYRHPDRETGVSCASCGRPICPDCMTSTPVGMRCPECASDRTPVRRVNFGGLAAGGTAPATMVLIGLNLLAFLAELASGAELFRGGGSVYRDGALFGPLVADGEPYRIVTSGFLHAGLIHIGLNMYVLYILGSVLEPGIGTPRFVGLYVASLLGGAFGALLLDPNALTVGASGAVFGLMSSTFLIARHRGLEALAQQIGFFLVLNLFLTFSINGISVGGHIGGLVAGGLAGLAFIRAERHAGGNAAPLEYLVLVAISAVAVAGSLIVAGGS